LVSATEAPGVVRVAFAIDTGETRQSEIVCYVRAEDLRIGIYYSHHVWRHRMTPTSVWEEESTMRAPMTPQLEAQIMVNVPNELWSSLAKTVKVLPVDFNKVRTGQIWP
jgi:hypothetical protein